MHRLIIAIYILNMICIFDIQIVAYGYNMRKYAHPSCILEPALCISIFIYIY